MECIKYKIILNGSCLNVKEEQEKETPKGKREGLVCRKK